jgi:hypothetical protein
MSWQFLLTVMAVPLISVFIIGLILLPNAVPARGARPAPRRVWLPKAASQPVPMIGQDGHDALVAELAGLLRRHLDILPQNYEAIPAWERLVEDTVRTLVHHKLAPVAKLAAERQCATTH